MRSVSLLPRANGVHVGMTEPPERDARPPRNPWTYVNAGLQFAVTVGLGAGLGWWLDQRYGWEPWGTAGCGFLAVVLAVYHLLRMTL
jgi:hypothetical protein